MSTRTVTVRLLANVQGLTAGLATGAASVKGFSSGLLDNARKNEQAFNTVGQAAGVMGAVVGAGVLLAVNSFANFDQAMSNVQAATMETSANMDRLGDAAIQAGADTAFSAGEAAAGIEELAKAGISTADIIGGGLAGALDLAAAGGIGVAEAAETTASALTQFNLEGSQASHVADLLAAGAGKAQGGVSDMGAALNQAGLVASQVGLSIEETTGSLAMFASAGLVGSDAGTSFRAMLLRLTNPTDEVKGLMSDLGINVYDAQGAFVGMESIAGQLQTQMGGLDEETRNAALGTIFGSDAIRAASILYKGGAEGVAEWIAKVHDSGYAAEAAAIRMDNLRGDLEELSGSFETAMIGLGASADGPLRDLVQNLTELINKFGELSPGVQSAVLKVAAVTASLGLASAAVLTFLPKIAATTAALGGMGVTAAGTATALKGIAVAGAGIAVADWWTNKAGEIFDLQVASEGLAGDLLTLGESGKVTGELLDVMGSDLGRLGKTFTFSSTSLEGFFRPFSGYTESAQKIDEALASMPIEEMAVAFDGLAAAGAKHGVTLDQMVEKLPLAAAAAEDAGTNLGSFRDRMMEAADATRLQRDGIEGLAPGYGVAAEAAEDSSDTQVVSAGLAEDAIAAQVEEMDALLDAYQTMREVTMSVGESQGAYLDVQRDTVAVFAELTEAVDENGDTIDTTGMSVQDVVEKYGDLSFALNDAKDDFDLTTESGYALQTAIHAEADAAVLAAEKTRDYAIANGVDAVDANAAFGVSLAESRAAISLTIQSAGFGAEAADAMALSIIGVPDLSTTEMRIEDEAAKAAVAAQEERLRLLELARTTKLYADPGGAISGAATAQSAINNVSGRTVFLNVVTQYSSNGTPGPLEGYATGGMVKARPGGRIVRIGEGGEDEAVIPKGRLTDIIMGSYDLGQVAASRAMAPQMVPQMVPYRDVSAPAAAAAVATQRGDTGWSGNLIIQGNADDRTVDRIVAEQRLAAHMRALRVPAG